MAAVRLTVLRVDGGIVSLAAYVTEHAGAIEYDLLTKTGHELRDVGRTLSWNALTSFIFHVDAGSALVRETDPEYALWTTRVKTNGILADIYDVLAQINANLIAMGSHSKAKPVKPYPRPGIEEERGDTRKIGKGALPRGEFREWLKQKRIERNGRNG